MPSTGTPSPRTAGSRDGAPGSYTEAGPPDRISPPGRRASSSATGVSNGTISEYTWASRTRRAMSCAYWAPKSRTSTGRGSVTAASLPGHAHALRPLLRLSLGLDGGRHHDLGLLELPDVGVPGGGHGGPQGPEEVQLPVVLVGRAQEDLPQGPDAPGGHPRAPGQIRVERGHAPVEA